MLAFKHGRRIALAPMLARLIAARLPELEGSWLVVPVPLHPLRLWQRGFNQSALLAREIARQRRATLLVDGLVRRSANGLIHAVLRHQDLDRVDPAENEHQQHTKHQGELDQAKTSAADFEKQLKQASDKAADLELRATKAETDLATLQAQQKPAKKR